VKESKSLDFRKYSGPFDRIIIPVLLVVIAVFSGIIGYTLIGKMSFLDALYMTVITIATVGYREVQPLSPAGKIFTIFFIVFGVATVVYTAGTIIDFIIEGNIFGIRRRKRMEEKIKHLKNHYIVCSFGRVGHQIVKELLKQNKDFVVIDQKESAAQELEALGVPYFIGNISDDILLEKAGVARAKVLFAAADSDVENVYVTLAAKVVNPNIFVVARAAHKETESKLKKAGADKVISPYFIAGSRMASMALNPVAVEFLDIATGSDNVEMWVREFKVDEKSPLAGKTLGQANIRKSTGAMVLSIKKSTGSFLLSPNSTSLIEAGDILIVLGTGDQLKCLESCL